MGDGAYFAVEIGTNFACYDTQVQLRSSYDNERVMYDIVRYRVRIAYDIGRKNVRLFSLIVRYEGIATGL